MELAKEEIGQFLYHLFWPKEIFFNICVLSQYIVHWVHFQNTHTFTYQKTLLHILFCLFLKSSKAFSVSLMEFFSWEFYEICGTAILESNCEWQLVYRNSHRKCSMKKRCSSKISQNSKQNTRIGISFLIKMQTWGLQVY